MSKYQTTSRKSKSAQQKKMVTFGCIAVALLLILAIALLLLPTPEKNPQPGGFYPPLQGVVQNRGVCCT